MADGMTVFETPLVVKPGPMSKCSGYASQSSLSGAGLSTAAIAIGRAFEAGVEPSLEAHDAHLRRSQTADKKVGGRRATCHAR